MKLSAAICSTLLVAAMVSSAASAESGLMFSVKIERDGIQLAAPKVWASFGKDAAVQVGSEFRVEFSASDLGSAADMKIKLFQSAEGAMKLVASPRIHASLNEESSVKVNANDGVSFTVSFVPTKQLKPL